MLAYRSRGMMLPSRQEKGIGTSERPVSQLNTQPMVSPVNASRQTSRTAAHHSGPERLASPYSVEDFHLLSFASLSWRSLLMAITPRTGHVRGTSALPSTSDSLAAMSGRTPFLGCSIIANPRHTASTANGATCTPNA